MKIKPKPISDYILIEPDKPKGGSFDVGSAYIDETGVIVGVGPKVSDEVRALKGKRVIFNAWPCEEKKVQGQRFYFAPESANVICAVI